MIIKENKYEYVYVFVYIYVCVFVCDTQCALHTVRMCNSMQNYLV